MKTKIYIFLLAASGLAFPYQDQVSEKVETERINGVLCKNNESWIRYLYKDAQPWTPTAEQVGATEQSLNLYLKQEPHTYALWTRTERQTFWKKMAGYKRQYFGFYHKGREKIYGNFYCDETPLSCEPRDVDDGGDCYVRVIFDVKDKKVIFFLRNGKG